MTRGQLNCAISNETAANTVGEIASSDSKADLTNRELAQLAAVDLMYIRAEISLITPSDLSAKRIADHLETLNRLIERISQ